MTQCYAVFHGEKWFVCKLALGCDYSLDDPREALLADAHTTALVCSVEDAHTIIRLVEDM